MRKGFGLVLAIIFIVLVATLGALALSLSTESTKATADAYLKEQAELLAQSATEYALLAISGHDRTTGCLNEIQNIGYPNADNPIFRTNIQIQYILDSAAPTDCDTIATNIDTHDSNLTALIDVYVTSVGNASPEPIRYHRRTIQKP